MSDFNEQNVGARWYVAHTYSGYENKVKMNLEKIIENRNLSHLIFDIRIPTETIVESNGGEEKEIEEKIFPAYVLIKMIMTDESWHVVRNIRGVTDKARSALRRGSGGYHQRKPHFTEGIDAQGRRCCRYRRGHLRGLQRSSR